MTQTRRARLANDYREVSSMVGPVMNFRVLSGTPPYAEAYEFTFRIRSIVAPTPTYRGIHVVRVELPAGYPQSDFPRAVMMTKPFPYHANWFRSGAWCYGSGSHNTEGLGNFIVRLMQTLQFDPGLIDVTSAANLDAANWYTKNKHLRGLFPCDTTRLPQPSVDGMVVHRVTHNG